MNFTELATDESILSELGQRLLQRRLSRNITQAQLAGEAGISKRTVERIEAGKSTQLSSLISILRALQLVENLDTLIPEPLPSPIEQLKLHSKQRQRASTSGIAEKNSEWTWDDDA